MPAKDRESVPSRRTVKNVEKKCRRGPKHVTRILWASLAVADVVSTTSRSASCVHAHSPLSKLGDDPGHSVSVLCLWKGSLAIIVPVNVDFAMSAE